MDLRPMAQLPFWQPTKNVGDLCSKLTSTRWIDSQSNFSNIGTPGSPSSFFRPCYNHAYHLVPHWNANSISITLWKGELL